MDTNNMFEKASRMKLRFPFLGSITTEDLWDVEVENLDKLYKILNGQMKLTKEESLLGTPTKKEEELSLKIELIKYVVKTKLEESAARLTAIENKQKKQKILEIMAQKQDSSLQSKSEEELTKMLAELD